MPKTKGKTLFSIVSLMVSLFVVNSLAATPWCNVYDGGWISAPSTSYQGETITLDGNTPSADTGLEYMWLWNPDADYVNGSAVELGTSTSPTYNVTMNSPGWFIRCARPQGCGWSWSQARETSSQYVSVTSCSAILSAVNTVDVTSCGANNGKLNIDPNVNGGTVLPFEVYYTYNGQEYYGGGGFNDYSNNYVTNLPAGNYTNIRLVDANGCEDSKSGPFTINENCTVSNPGCVMDCSLLNTNYNDFMFIGTFNGHAYFKRGTGDVEYWTALSYAQSLGGYLVTINSQAENDWLKNNAGGQFWLGLTDAGSEGYFQWANGDALTYTNWNAGEPNNSGNEDYVHFLTNGQWNDVSDNAFNWAVIEVDCPCATPTAPTCEISCPADIDASACDMDGTDPAITGYPTVSCGDYEFTYVDNTTGGNGCATTITRNWTATPSTGCEPVTLVKYDMDACYSNSGNNSPTDYSEFTPTYPNSGGFALNASSLDRNSGGHSCTYGLDNTLATCFGMDVQSWSDNNAKAIRFSVTLTPGDVGNLTQLSFNELAPTHYQWVADPWSTSPVEGTNNYPTKYGVRVLKNGVEIFQDINNNTTQDWTYESFNFADNPDFQITSTTTFEFEILAYSPVGNGSSVYAWDVENIKIKGCTGVSELTCTQTITLTDNLTLSAEVAGTLTCEQTEVQLLASSNETNATYEWTGPNGFTSTEQNPTTSEMGEHTVVITKGCCTETASVTVMGSTAEPVSAPTNNGPLTCNETTVTLSSNSVNNGSLTYEWTGPNGFTSTDSNPTTTEAGTYTLKVTNVANGCMAEATTTVDANTELPNVSGTGDVITCSKTTAQLTGTSTTTGVTYSWEGPNGYGAIIASPTTTIPGEYTLTVTGPNGCENSATITVIDDTAEPVGEATGGEITCNDPMVGLVATSTTPNVNYSWNGPQGYAANGPTANAMLPGTYTVTIIGANGCFVMIPVEVTEDITKPTISTVNDGPLTCDKTTINLTTTAAGAISYAWTGPAGFTSTVLNPVVTEAGTYTVIATAANGCTEEATTIVEGDTVQPTVEATNDGPLTCDKTSVTLTATSTGAASYSWNGPAGYASMDQNPTVTAAGTYTVIVTASNGCTAEATTTIAEDTTLPLVAVVGGEITCNDPTITMNTTTDGISYAWTGPAGFTSTDLNPTVDAAGEYTVTVTAANGCTETATVTITEDTTEPTISIENDGPLTCDKLSVTMTTTSTGAVSYAWTGPAGFTSTDANPTTDGAGEYTVIVTAANGCTAEATTTIAEDITDPTVSIENDGPLTCDKLSVTMTTTSTGAASYAWAGPAGFTSTDANPTTDVAGEYTVIVTAANGCTAEATTIIEEDIATPNASATGGTLTCNETTVPLGASSTTAGVTYAWSGPAGFSSAEQNPTANNAGEYTVTVTAANGCTATATAVIDEDLATPIVEATGGTLTCMINAIDIVATSDVANATYAWAGPAGFTADVATATATEAGTYTVTVTGENGCTETATAIVDFVDDLVSAITAPQEVCNNEGATFEADLAGAGATYAWDFGADATPATSTNAVETVVWSTTGLKNVTLTVTKGVCTESYDAVILVNEEVIAIAGEDQAICQGGCVELGGNTAEAGYTYLWTPNLALNSNTVATPTACPLTTTTYTLAATKNGCTTTSSVTVEVDVNLNPVADAGTDKEICLGEGVQLGGNLTTTDGVIMWTPNIGLDDPTSATPTATPNQTTTYTIMTMRNGCQAEDEVTVTVEDCTFDLALNKVLAEGQAEVLNPGEQVTFTINVFNQGEVPASDIQLVDYIPTGLTLADADWTMSGGNAIITLPGTLAAGDNTSVDITFDIANTASGQLINYAEIASATNANTGEEGDDIDSEADALEANDNGGTVNTAQDDNVSDDGTTDEDDHDPEDITVQTIDLELTKVVSESEVNVGDEVTWTITLENKGPANATGVTVSDGFPPFGLTYVSDNPAAGTSFDAASLIWTVGDLANGASVTLEIVTTVDFIGPYVNTAQVATADQTDIDSTPGNDDGDQSEDEEDSASVSAKIIDLELGKTADVEMVNVGDQFTYTLTIVNEGPSVGTGITVVDNLPAEVAFVSSSASLGTYDEATGIWTVGSLAVNQTETLDITVTAIAGDVALNVAQVASANEPDIDSEPDNDDGDQSEDDEDNVLVTIQVLSSLGDYTFLDDNANGIQDAGEAPLSGVIVNLYDATDLTTIIATDTTDASGIYGFDNLDPADDYIVEFVSPDGFVLTTQSGNASDGTGNDSDAGADGFTDLIDLDPTENDPTIDAGFIPNDAGLGDYTFIDDNQNGIQDAGEAPVGGIIVNLYDATDLTTILATDTTDATGLYQFIGLDPDLDYIVEFVPSDDYVLTTQLGNASDGTADDSDAGADGFTDLIDLDPTEFDPTIDAGFIPNIASLGDYTFIDANENGTQDAGEAAISGVIVNLYDATDLTTILATDTTDTNGLYGFTQLDPALDYIVEFIAPNGFILTDQSGNASAGTADDSDADATTGLTDLIDLNPGENDPTIDAGFIPSDAGLGDYTFIDANENGIQDAGEAPVGGIVVNLYDATDVTTILSTTTTDANGFYQFIGLDPDLDYIVEFVPSDDYVLTTQSGNASDGTADDSDAGADGFTDLIDLDPTEFDPTIDAGFIPNVASLGDYTFIDANENGTQDAGEAPVSGVIVNLYDATNTTIILATDTTDANGLYGFTQLDPALDYIVEFIAPNGFILTDQSGNASAGTGNDSDADTTTGLTDLIDLNPGENDPTIDAGFIPSDAGLGDYTFIDANENGIQDAGEAPVGGVIVNLYDATDLTTILAIDTTDATGLYQFIGLDPALDYIVEFVAPTGFILTDQSGNASAGTADDSDADATTGLTDLIDLNPTEFDPTIDAGFIPVEYDLALIKELADSQVAFVAVDDTVNFTITIANQGNVPSGDFTVLDQLQDGLEYVGSSNGGTHANGLVTWNLTGLLPGETMTITIDALVTTVGTGKFVNWAEISEDSGDDADSTPDDNTGNGFTEPNDSTDNHNDITLDTPEGDEDDNDFEEIFIDRGLSVSSRVFLQGPLVTEEGGMQTGFLMRDDLRIGNYLPMSEPYTERPNFVHANGGESINTNILQVEGAKAIVDWVLVELRDPLNKALVLDTRAALLQRDGEVVDVDGLSAVNFEDMEAGSYHVAIRHRNHLGVMTAEPVEFNGTDTPVVDFTDVNTATYGEHAQIEVNGVRAMWAGNTTGEHRVAFQGAANSVNAIFFEVLTADDNATSQTNYVQTGYCDEDVDIDANAIYQGPNNGPNKMFFNVILHPANTQYLSNFIIEEQLPFDEE